MPVECALIYFYFIIFSSICYKNLQKKNSLHCSLKFWETSFFIPWKPNTNLSCDFLLSPSPAFWSSSRSISKCQLNTLLHLHLIPIYLILSKGPYACAWISHLEGGFTLRCLQRLSLPDLATLPWIWYPTDTPVVRPSRSSRTKDSSSQISYARAG